MTSTLRASATTKGEYLAAGLVLLACLLPLLLTPALPSIDFYAHVVRYNALAHPDAPIIADNYLPNWQLLPNLGADLIGVAVLSFASPLIGGKLLAALVILAPVLGSMSLARVLHGRLEWYHAALAGLLGYNLILFWGFANFLLGTGIALWSIGWWIAQQNRPMLRFGVMALVGVAIIFVHGLVFGLWGLLLGGIEIMAAIQARQITLRALAFRAGRLISLAIVPLLIFFQMSTAEADGGMHGAFSNLAGYAERGGLFTRMMEEILKRLDSLLRVSEVSTSAAWHMPWIDRIFGLCLWLVLGLGVIKGAFGLDRRLWGATAIAFLLIGVMPPNLFGVGHLDERMPLIFLSLIVAGLSFDRARAAGMYRLLPMVLVGLFVIKTALTAWVMTDVGSQYRTYLQAVEKIQTGETASAVFLDGRKGRDKGLFCAPLLFLLNLENGTAVPTFANPTQQPIRITGRLEDALMAARQSPAPSSPTEEIALLQNAQFDTIVSCGKTALAQEVAGTKIQAADSKWVLYSAP